MSKLLEELNQALMLAQFRVSEMNDYIEAEEAIVGGVSGQTAASCDEAEAFENGLLHAIAIAKRLDKGDRSLYPGEG